MTALIALIALVYAKGQLSEASHARRQARDLADEVAQPYVVAYIEPSAASAQLIDLVIKNFGQTGASAVRLSLTPKPQVAPEGGGPAKALAIPDPIAYLAPGQEWRTFWDSGLSRVKSDLSESHEGVVTFRNEKGELRSTPAVLDFKTMQRTWVNVKTIHDAAKSLDAIKKEIGNFHALKQRRLNVSAEVQADSDQVDRVLRQLGVSADSGVDDLNDRDDDTPVAG
ncbi:hypothetical protein [Rhodococcus sp. NPDC003348]